ncbi:hypothetical protein MMC13_002362 [Lambiella insularis]|nr:hypothetical protein [Lambiella insularis]
MPSAFHYTFVFAAVTIPALLFLYNQARRLSAPNSKSLPPPLSTRLFSPTSLQTASVKSTVSLPYPPDALPGGRDVDSPYGWMRVYEWGPESGRKVLLVHGISTPCVALRDVARGLVARGCRVCLFEKVHETVRRGLRGRDSRVSTRPWVFRQRLILALKDLWGRGWSDTPLDLPHDARLFGSQILIAIATSPISWTGAGSDGFSLVGYSLGGGIIMSFAASFPELISSIVLLAPAGILRAVHADYHSPIMRFPWLFPASWVRSEVRRILCGDQVNDAASSHNQPTIEVMKDEKAASGERPKPLNVGAIIRWQVDNNPGFVLSFINSLKHAPTTGQESDWQKIGMKLTEVRENGKSSRSTKVSPSCSKILILAGERDPLVIKDELIEDATRLLGAANIEVKVIDDGHGFAVDRGAEVAEHISKFWDLKKLDASLLSSVSI